MIRAPADIGAQGNHNTIVGAGRPQVRSASIASGWNVVIRPEIYLDL